ncbi:DUF1295 domain-containing protein [Corynebacterium epidermidicanis]|uniref:3-oxo-5-alpha-steroid 4-dehydrogenase n=1 Tax=Corynebacterium epidermidicanis TaxID=1050174 RepID=A0A0G3GT01_9CORY|nr:DUF1295 domain-containing protein [Corynebacterium epidermidicanis]AKK04254.1 3-oxo-5-alpha-steroid 4-dehydrogenase [Corynebacterium epidermidicanis]
MTLDLFIVAWIGIALFALAALWFIDAPYGRQMRSGWGPGVPNRLAWTLMEVVVLVSFYAVVWASGVELSLPTITFAALLTCHYVNRSFIYPWRTRTKGKVMPLSIMLMSVLFNSVNGFFLGSDLTALNRDSSWFSDPRFMIGLVIFGCGMALNMHSDNILLRLRKPGDTGYHIPRGGAFRWVTSPNLLGEIIEWIGFAILTWSLSGLAFALWTCANLVPRARSNQRWYQQKFPDYPSDRRVLVPGVW